MYILGETEAVTHTFLEREKIMLLKEKIDPQTNAHLTKIMRVS